ncbi:MAG TPA: PKD domain-containing protein [Chitinophagales bacterium]|nr:PKD domain-containing protein [Chitinophagales bacterium]
MKSIFTLCAVFLVTIGFAQNTALPQPQRFHIAPDSHRPTAQTHRASNGAQRTSAVCDSSQLDYNYYNEIYASNNFLEFNGSWYNSQNIYAAEITSFVVLSHQLDYSYATQIFDSLAYVDQNNGLFSVPLAASTISVDSLGLFAGIFGDTVQADGKMTNDSLVFTIYPVNGSTVSTTPVKTVVYSGYNDLSQFFKGDGYLGYAQVAIGAQLTQGQGFAVKMQYIAKDTSSHMDLSYTYADSCITIEYLGNQYSSPAYPSPFFGAALYGEIDSTGPNTASVTNISSAYYYNIPGVDRNCTFLYVQNWELLPIVTVCTNYTATIQGGATKACPGSSVDLTANVFGTNSSNITYTWSTTGGSLTSTSDATTSIVMPQSGNVTVTLTVNDGSANTTASYVVTNSGITLSIPNSNPITLTCGGSAVQVTTSVSGSTSGRTYSWNTGATTNAISVSTPGTYSVTVTNGVGCSATASVAAQYPGNVSNSVDFTVPSPICIGYPATFTNTSTGITGWTAAWDFGDGGTNTSIDGTHTYQNQGTFSVKVTMDSAGCDFVSPSHSVAVQSAGVCAAGINDLSFNSAISMVPNPTNGNVNFSVVGVEKNISIRVYDIIGNLVTEYSANDVPASFNKTFDFSSFANGAYLVKVQSGSKIAVKRLVINK